MYLSTVLDDFSCYVIAWKLCTNMRAEDVTETLNLALQACGCDQAHVQHKPRLLSDNGPSYIAGELADYIKTNTMSHVRGAPCHPQTQGKIERWHQMLKNTILLENYFYPGDLEAQINAFIESSTITTSASMRASKTSPQPMLTSAERPPSSKNAKGSKSAPSNITLATSTTSRLNLNHQMRPTLL